MMNKKVLITLLLAVFVIAGGWAQKKHDNYYGSNDKNGYYRSDECHSNGHHGGKHKKHKKHKHHDYDNCCHQQGGCNKHDHDYGYNGQGDQCGACNGRQRDNDRDDNWSNPDTRTCPSTWPVRNVRTVSKPEQIPTPRHTTTGKGGRQQPASHRPATGGTSSTVKKTVYSPKTPAKAVKTTQNSTSLKVGSTSRRPARPGN